jgi:hypothetical protein
VMQEESSTWDALHFLDQMKATNPGSDFWVKKDTQSLTWRCVLDVTWNA